jgi:uncharacterized protein (DUF58 family)
MKKTIAVLMLSLAGLIAVWRFKPAPTTSSGATPSSSAAAATDVTVPGSVKNNRYNTVRVQLVFSGGTITDVQLLHLSRYPTPTDAESRPRQLGS